MNRSWSLKGLFLSHLVIAAIIISFLSPATRWMWDGLDVALFRLLNGTLEGSPFLQNFWAIGNHKMHDWLEDFVILAFFVIYIRQATKGMRKRRVAQFIFCIVFAALIIYFVNRVIFKENFSVYRKSPTMVLPDCFHLSEWVSWIRVKDHTTKSFPADHATTALLFAASYSFFAGRRLALAAWVYAIYLCLPRLVVGAHWLSDIIAGSVIIVLFFTSWAFFTPLHQWATEKIENLLTRKKIQRV